MRQEHISRRLKFKALLERAEKNLSAMRSSAGGHSRAIRLHLEREIHARNKDLALAELELANIIDPNPSSTRTKS